MINTFSDMLLALKAKEEKALSEFNLKHPTIIGDAYEGIAEKLLNRAIFKGLDIRVVSGHFKNDQDQLSPQIDCMVVEGEGLNIPNTKHHIYNSEQVIAVIEVKKNLNKNDLIDSFIKMKKISQIYEPRDMTEGEFRLFRDAFKSAVGIDPPEYKAIKNYDLSTEMIYHNLLIESILPLRIVFGFYGYSSMKTLRKGVVNYLTDYVTTDLKKPIAGYAPIHFPSLIFTRDSSLVKVNGAPYMPRLDEEGYWDFYTSIKHNPLYILLELLWTKLSYRYSIDSNIFGEDLIIESHYPFLRCRPVKSNDILGYNFAYVDLPNDNDEKTNYIEWEPVELNEPEFKVLYWLCEHGELSLDNLHELISDYSINEDELLRRLNEERLLYIDERDKIRLLTVECAIVVKNGKVYAGENKSGRVTRWSLR